jgi:hypothetical protein
MPGRRGVRGAFGGSVSEVDPKSCGWFRSIDCPSSLVLRFSKWIKIMLTILSRAGRSIQMELCLKAEVEIGRGGEEDSQVALI